MIEIAEVLQIHQTGTASEIYFADDGWRAQTGNGADQNGDNVINQTDVNLLQAYVNTAPNTVGSKTGCATANVWCNGHDINLSGTVDSADVTAIQTMMRRARILIHTRRLRT